MLSWLIRRRIDEFEARHAYDMSYVREMLAASPKAALLFSRALEIGRFQRGVPADVFHVVKLVGVLHEDCGPCVQLGVQLASAAGVAPETLRAVVRGDYPSLPEPCRLAAEFARGVLTRDPDTDELRAQLVKRYGKLGLVSLALALTSSRLYPTVKVALGFGKTCSQVEVAGKVVQRPHSGASLADGKVSAA